MNQVDTVIALVKTRQQRVLQEMDVRAGVEVLCLMSVRELTAGNIDACKDRLGVSFPARWNLRLRIADRPCCV